MCDEGFVVSSFLSRGGDVINDRLDSARLACGVWLFQKQKSNKIKTKNI